MPELPEVETMCRCIAGAVGCRIRDVQRPSSPLQSILISPPLGQFRRKAVGKTIKGVRRVGKRVVLVLEDGKAGRPHPNPLPKGEGTLDQFLPAGQVTAKTSARAGGGTLLVVLEPRMTGIVMLDDPPNQKHLRLVFQLDPPATSHSSREQRNTAGKPARYTDACAESNKRRVEQILFWDQRGLGVARLLAPDEFLQAYGPDRLGPDALTISVETLQERLGGSRRAIKVALLDQKALVGVGNLYASEILHLARIHPATPCRRIQPEQWSSIHAAMRKVLRAAIRHQGSTLGDGTYRIGRNRTGNYQLYHRVYQRAGKQCLLCGEGIIERIVQAQRSTFFCPACQRSCSSGRKR
jgi:formamidopyrimidine-DNA glycosylase